MCVQSKVTKPQGDDWLRKPKKADSLFLSPKCTQQIFQSKNARFRKLALKRQANLKVPEPKLCKVDIKKEGPGLGKC